MSRHLIIVSGADGQLGNEFRKISSHYPFFEFRLVNRAQMDLEHPNSAGQFVRDQKPAFVINCAAYTAVDKAEADSGRAFMVNATAVGELATVCKEVGAGFIHFSTDYVFDGHSSQPYREDAPTAPINVYGASKLEGERLCMLNNPSAIIIRTSWVYASTGHNFVKTIIRLLSERPAISVVNDQVGSPTWAADLANATMHIIAAGNWKPGIYHYSNKGSISWYEFALAIKEQMGSACVINPIPTSQYPTPAKRPSFSLLDTTSIQSAYALTIPHWKESLLACLKELQH